MNSNERLRWSRVFDRKYRQLAEKYEPAMRRAAKGQVKYVIELIKERGIESAKNALNTYLYNKEVTAVITKLFKQMALWAANEAYKPLLKYVREYQRQVKKKEGGAFGFNSEWNSDIEQYLRQYLLTRAVLPITDTIKKDILEAIAQGQSNGWGIDRIIQELRNVQSETGNLARTRVRTELSVAANFGYKMAENKIPFETNKVWIAARDSRTRNSHNAVNGTEVDSNADFHVPIVKGKLQTGVDLMTGPGDPEATPGNIINCRCTLAFKPKRDKNGRLIKKQTQISII